MSHVLSLRRFRSSLLACIACAASCAFTHAAVAVTYYVSICGNNAWVGVDVNCVAPLGPKRTIQAAINAASNGDTIIVMPGTYLETIDFDGKAITLTAAGGPEVTTIDGNGAAPVVRCNSFEGPGTVLQGFHITGANTTVNGGAMLNVLSSPTIINCRFTGNFTTGNGAAMANFAASPTITDSIFAFNQAGNEPPGANQGQGGAIYSSGGPVTLTNCFLQTCYATGRGGFIALFNNATANITDCDFHTGGGSFTHGDGGGIHADNSTVTASNCLFDGVRAQEGGSVMAVNGSNVSFAGTTFHSGGAEVRGGGASIIDSTATFVGCQFSELSSSSGGAIYASASTVSATWCGFLDNSAPGISGVGAGVRAHQSVLNFAACTFVDNEATWNGGGIYAYGGAMTINGCSFSSNLAERGGGGAYTVDCALEVTNSTFSSNTAMGSAEGQIGGALAITSSITSQSALVHDCTFTGNLAREGGAIFGSWLALTISGCTFENNQATWNGGAVYLLTDPGTPANRVLNSQFTGNSAVSRGGAMDVLTTGTVFAHGCTFTGNSAQSGGAVNCSQSRTILSACRLNNNNASGQGSAVMVSLNGRLHMVNTIVHNNTAPAGGGAIANPANEFWQTTIDIRNCTIANNNGGGINIADADANAFVGNSIVWGNPNGGQFIGLMPTVRSSCVQGGAPGQGNISDTPLFLGALGGNYRLNAASPCIDAGNVWASAPDTLDLDSDGNTIEIVPFDFDGNPRIADVRSKPNAGCSGVLGAIDIGAFETAGNAHGSIKPGDVNADGVVDVSDLLAIIAAWGPCPAGCCSEDFNLDGVVNVSDLLIVIGNWG